MKRRLKHPVLVYGAIAAVHLSIAWITWRDIGSAYLGCRPTRY
jgi:hypothetical protein